MVLANLLQLQAFQDLIWSWMSAFRYSTGRKGRETNRCTHIPVLRQSIVPAHKGSGRVNPREVFPWDPQNPVVLGTITLGTQTQSEKLARAGFDTETPVCPSGRCQDTPWLPTLTHQHHGMVCLLQLSHRDVPAHGDIPVVGTAI